MTRSLALLVIAGCSFRHGAAGGPPNDDALPGEGGAGSDARVDDGANGDGQAADAHTGVCVGSFVVVCAPTAPTTDYNFNNATALDTTACTGFTVQSQGAGLPELCVVYGKTITVGNTLTATGTRALVLAATGTVNISGLVDVSSQVGRQAGAGANDPLCGTPSAGNAGTTGYGGGAGGSFGDAGGAGGNAIAGTNGAAASTIAMLTRVVGGCAGAAGNTGGARGDGGGAVMLISGTKITVGNTVDASGAAGTGGTAATAGGGGGGGGAGGFIGLDAPMLHVSGGVFANGGGGGGGASVAGGPGANGVDGGAAYATFGGGPGGLAAGNGGAGAGGAITTGGAGLPGATGGGGGGGGGAGAILVIGHAPDAAGVYSPMYVVH